MDDFGLDMEEEYVSNTRIATSIYEHEPMINATLPRNAFEFTTSFHESFN